ncbi:hypothetical protein B0T26DRAFT_670030 [Lasiosphaeria miniovina]|uniref:C2H2-type domain-containing protein n=1 Tax=Lasiosphaeria miniovina TaxID=1954250 RepID=A0AA40EB99_9PEZI|nr:uncharacterized protein B0T26DRAFT_670030 [Lasiosphaeria miniovina]KAK0733640.1 hypothetical protein B0T26DRAFT_670030 [Lasiosphaeria miniovina]
MTSPRDNSVGDRKASSLPTTVPPAWSLTSPSQAPPFSQPVSSATQSTRILTPSSGAASDGLSLSPGVNSTSSQSSQPGGSSLFYSNLPWTTPASSAQQQHTGAYTYQNSSSNNSGPYGSQRLFSGSPMQPHFSARSSTSTANGDSLPAPPSYQDQPPFPTQIGSGGGGGGRGGGGGGGSLGSSLPTQPGSQQSVLAQPAIGAQNSTSTQPQTSGQTASGVPPQDGGSSMAPPIGYGGARGHPMQPGASYATYGQIQAPVLSNVHHPGAPLSVVGGMGMQGYGHHHHPGLPQHHMYVPHSSGGPTSQERPFKCDQCPQSFNRNHDLKRHKRIHLAVKPFPCDHCEKSFSRKDALKRHKLVKGCGGKDSRESRDGTSGGNDASPIDRSDAVSDDNESGSPDIKKE